MHLSLKSGLGKLQGFLSRVLSGRVLDLFGSFTQDDTTVSDSSGEGNDATLYSGRYVATDGVADKGIQANVTAAGSADYYVTGKVRPTGTSCRVQINDTASGEDDITGLTSAVWQDFTSATFSAQTASNVAIGWSSNSGFLAVAADWSDVKLVNATTGATVARYQLNESTDGDLNGYPALDSSGNGYHGTHVGCAGGTGEGIDPDVVGAAFAANEDKMYFDGVNDYVEVASASEIDNIFAGGGTVSAKIILSSLGGSSAGRIMQKHGGGATDGWHLGVASNGLFFIQFWQNGSFKLWNATTTSITFGEQYSVSVTYDNTSASNNPSFEINGVSQGVTISSSSGIPDTPDDDSSSPLRIGNRADGSRQFNGTIFDVNINSEAIYQGVGNTNADWTDQIGSNNGTVNGSPVTVGQKRETILQTAGMDWNKDTTTYAGKTILVPESDTTAGQDALGNAIAEPRPTAATFNLFGDGEYGRVADADSLDLTTEATWEIWINPYGDFGVDKTFLSKWEPTSGRSWMIYQNDTQADNELSFICSSGGTTATTYLAKIPVTDALAHVVFTFNGSALKGYINGSEVTVTVITGTLPASLYVGTEPIQIGVVEDTASPAERQISRPKIYNRALTADEVLQNFNAQKSSFGL